MSEPAPRKLSESEVKMNESIGWYEQHRAEKAVRALNRNCFHALSVRTREEACEEALAMIPEGATVGIGGSMTIGQIGIFPKLKEKGAKIINPFGRNVAPESRRQVMREIFLSDIFLSSANAITEDGKLFFIDATGNRAAATIFGPEKVILVSGVNKIVRDLHEAYNRVRYYVAPTNARRLGYRNPCEAAGECVDCESPERICNAFVTLYKKPRQTDISVLLVGEALGI